MRRYAPSPMLSPLTRATVDCIMAVRVANRQRDLRSKVSVLELLRRTGVSERTVEALDAALDDPVDLHRDAGLFFRYGVTLEQLAERMGGSP